MNLETSVTININTPIPICVDYYIQTKAQYYKSYLGTIQYRLARISKWFSSYTLKDLTTSPDARNNISEFINHRLSTVKAGTVRKDASALQAMLNWYRKDYGLAIPDIFKQIRIPKDYAQRTFIPTDEQVYEVIGKLPSDDLKDVCLLLAETGCRRNEILNLRIQDVNTAKRMIVCNNTKNGTNRTVPLSRTAVAIFNKHLERLEGRAGTYLVFNIRGEFVSKQFRKAADSCHAYDFVIHSLRHYRLSKLIQAGHDHLLVSKVSGHKDVRTLSRYVHLDATDLAMMLFD
ncbi:tyrosine-type recombinase/integrase [Vibrio breoganii]